MNKGHLEERQNMVFITRWSFNKELLKCGLCLQGGLHSEVTFNTGLTVYPCDALTIIIVVKVTTPKHLLRQGFFWLIL